VLHAHFSPILIFSPGKMRIYWDFPAENYTYLPSTNHFFKLFRWKFVIIEDRFFPQKCFSHPFLLPPGKMRIYWDFPAEKWVYTEFSPRKIKYVLTHTHFPHILVFPLSYFKWNALKCLHLNSWQFLKM
jgi:hypothetical protein